MKTSTPDKVSAHVAILGVLRAIGIVLAVRLFLFLSLVGTFSLALIATRATDYLPLVVMIAYACLTTGPLAYLELKSRANGG